MEVTKLAYALFALKLVQISFDITRLLNVCPVFNRKLVMFQNGQRVVREPANTLDDASFRLKLCDWFAFLHYLRKKFFLVFYFSDDHSSPPFRVAQDVVSLQSLYCVAHHVGFRQARPVFLRLQDNRYELRHVVPTGMHCFVLLLESRSQPNFMGGQIDVGVDSSEHPAHSF